MEHDGCSLGIFSSKFDFWQNEAKFTNVFREPGEMGKGLLEIPVGQ
jgi:hypothetical protein